MKSNIYKTILILVISFIIFFVIKSNISESPEPENRSDEVQLTIKSEFENYLINQSIWLKVTLINNTDQPFLLRSPLDFTGVMIQITLPDRTILRRGFNLEPSTMIFDSLHLSVNDTLTGFMNLDWQTRHGIIKDNRITGEFKIKAFYQQIKSNESSISINLPGDDDKELFDQTFGASYPFTNDNQSRKLERLLNMYPESPYAPQLYEALFVFSPDKSDTARFLKSFENFFKYNFNNFNSIKILSDYNSYLYYEMKLNESQVNSRYEVLKNKYQNTFIESCILNDNFVLKKEKFE